MLGGIRHYDKECGKKKEKKESTDSSKVAVKMLKFELMFYL